MSKLPAVKNAFLVEVSPDGKETLAEGEATESKVVKVEATNSHQAIVNVLGLLNERDIPITSLDILEPNLESVFLHLTGKKLRE